MEFKNKNSPKIKAKDSTIVNGKIDSNGGNISLGNTTNVYNNPTDEKTHRQPNEIVALIVKAAISTALQLILTKESGPAPVVVSQNLTWLNHVLLWIIVYGICSTFVLAFTRSKGIVSAFFLFLAGWVGVAYIYSWLLTNGYVAFSLVVGLLMMITVFSFIVVDIVKVVKGLTPHR